MKNKSRFTRRDFITRSATGFAALTIVPRFVLGGGKFITPSDKVNVSLIGCGNQGKADVTQICDPDVPIRDQEIPNFILEMMSAWGSAPPAMGGNGGGKPIQLANIFALCDVDKKYANRVCKGYCSQN